MIIPLLLIGIAVYAVVRLISNGSRSGSSQREENDALNILNQRLAKGEISEEEYAKKKKVLRG